MAGNVVTKEMTEELIFSGADVIKALLVVVSRSVWELPLVWVHK